MKARVMLAVLIGTLAGCGQSDTTIVLSLTAGPALPPIGRLRLTLSNAGTSDLKLYPQSTAAAPVNFPATLAIVLPASRSGVLDIAVDGLNAGSLVVANGAVSVPIGAGRRTVASVELHAGSALCGNGMVDVGESCDDGNRASGDGCDYRCQDESGPDAGSNGADGRADTAADQAPAEVPGAAGADGGGVIGGNDGGGEAGAGGTGGASGAGGTAGPCAGAMFCDTFEAATIGSLPSGWTQTGGNPGDWSVVQATDVANSSKVLGQSSLTPDSRFIYTNKTGAPTAPWDGAVTVSADVKTLAFASNTGANRAAWICPRHAHLTDFYCLALVPSSAGQVLAQIQTNLGSSQANGVVFGVPVVIGTWCHVQVRIAANGTMTATVNDVAIPAFSPPMPLTSGYAAFGTQGATAAFDNVVVRLQ